MTSEPLSAAILHQNAKRGSDSPAPEFRSALEFFNHHHHHKMATPSRRPMDDLEESSLPDFGRLSLRSPDQNVFENNVSQPAQAPVNASAFTTPPGFGYNPYQNYHLPQYSHPSYPHTHPAYPMASTIPNPDNLLSPSRHVEPVPRTPDPATMQNGAFAGMAYNTSYPSTPHTPQYVGPSSTALVPSDQAAQEYGSTPKFEKLFYMAERYAYSHMNFPSASKDSQLHQNTKERLMRASTRDSAHQLGSTGATRYYLMAKVILQWITKHVFKQTLFSTFDPDTDRRITALRDNIYQDTPPMVKFQLLSEIGKEIRQIRDHPNFQRFLDTLVRNQGNKLWAIVKPLMHQTTTMDWEDLSLLMREAYTVAGDMAASPYEWRFDYAEVGTPYDTTMVNKDPYARGNDDEIARRGLVVRLGIAPAVYYRDNSGETVRIGQSARHHVLLKS
jgi:hypothetical protein